VGGLPPVKKSLERRALETAIRRLEDVPVVLGGPRAVGKSTLLAALAARLRRSVLDLDDPAARRAVAADPVRFLDVPRPVLVDEYARVPEVMDVVKTLLNRDGAPGQFLLPGSTRYGRTPAVAQTLTGRVDLLPVWPLSQGELGFPIRALAAHRSLRPHQRCMSALRADQREPQAALLLGPPVPLGPGVVSTLAMDRHRRIRARREDSRHLRPRRPCRLTPSQSSSRSATPSSPSWCDVPDRQRDLRHVVRRRFARARRPSSSLAPRPAPMRKTFDAIVIGTGQSGPPLAGSLAGAGWRVAVVERGKFGGTCVNTGCIPTKTMVASARVAYLARRAAEYGVGIAGPVAVDMTKVKARKDRVSGVSRRGVEASMRGNARITVFTDHARFVGDKRVRVGDAEITADHVFINVGARPFVPPLPGLDQVPFLTSSSMMQVDFLPEHLIVIGGSYVGLEFAQMFRRFGSEVTVVHRGPRLVEREDHDVSDAIREVLAGEGVRMRLGWECTSVRRRGEKVLVGVDCAQGRRSVTGSHLLLAVGRRPNTDDLGLEAARIAVDARGYIKVDEQLRTTAPGVFALGDCNGRGGFTHTSYNDYEVVEANLLHGGKRRVGDRIPAYNLYVDPPLGRCGLTEAQARATGRSVRVATLPMADVGRAFEMGETRGFLKLIVDGDDRQILGASLLGVGADEVVHTLLDLMYAKAPYTVLERAMHIHPTVSEMLPVLVSRLEPAVKAKAGKRKPARKRA